MPGGASVGRGACAQVPHGSAQLPRGGARSRTGCQAGEGERTEVPAGRSGSVTVKRAPPPGASSTPDGAAHGRGQLRGDGQAEARAAVVLAVERAEHLLALGRRHARARVDDRDAHAGACPPRGRAVTTPPSGVQRTALSSRLETICRMRSPSPTTVGAWSNAPTMRHAVAPRVLAPGVQRVLEERREVDLLVEQREAVRLELGQVEQVADQAAQAVGLVADDRVGLVPLVLGVDHVVRQRLHVAADGGQRRAQLVGHAHEEQPLVLLRPRAGGRPCRRTRG